MKRYSLVVLAVLLLIAPGSLPLRAQTPQAYSITEDPGFSFAGPSTVTVDRDGDKEVVSQVMPAGAGRDKEYRSHLLYDFASHTLYTQVLSDPNSVCGVQEYKDATVPKEFDMVSGGAELMKSMADPGDKTTPLGNDTVNGLPARVVKITSSQANAKVWYALKGDYPLKIVITDKDGKDSTFLEVKKLSFTKPAASLFTVPAACAGQQVPHAIVPSTKVTAITLAKIGNYTGACPAHLKLSGTITVDGPGTVFYQFGAGHMEPGATITFSAAGTQTVIHTITLQPKYGNEMGGSAILEAIGADAQGNHDVLTQGSNNSDFNITCTSGGGK